MGPKDDYSYNASLGGVTWCKAFRNRPATWRNTPRAPAFQCFPATLCFPPKLPYLPDLQKPRVRVDEGVGQGPAGAEGEQRGHAPPPHHTQWSGVAPVDRGLREHQRAPLGQICIIIKRGGGRHHLNLPKIWTWEVL